jgi:hypothetical protein
MNKKANKKLGEKMIFSPNFFNLRKELNGSEFTVLVLGKGI